MYVFLCLWASLHKWSLLQFIHKKKFKNVSLVPGKVNEEYEVFTLINILELILLCIQSTQGIRNIQTKAQSPLKNCMLCSICVVLWIIVNKGERQQNRYGGERRVKHYTRSWDQKWLQIYLGCIPKHTY